MIAGRYGRLAAPGFRWVVTLANPNLGNTQLKPDLWVRLLRPNGREVWQPVEFELTARSDGAILKKLRPWIVAAELGRYWPVLFVVADERVRDKIASIGYNLEIPVVAATVEDFVIWLAMGLRTDFRARPVRGYGPYLPAEGRQSVKAGFFGGSRKDSYAFLWASGPSPMTASMRFFSCSRSSSGVVQTMWL